MRFQGACVLFMAALHCCAAGASSPGQGCDGQLVPTLHGVANAWKMADGIATYAKLNINIDGYGRAYHRNNYATEAVIHLCNAGQVFLANGSSYHGSESNATCTGRFMKDIASIEAAGWKDPGVGVVRWYGILATGKSSINGRQVEGIVPVTNGEGYYVSPTALFDQSVVDPARQDRYVDPLGVPAGVVPDSLRKAGVALGSFGVAIHAKKGIAVPFVVGDIGPLVGEGTPALARQLAGLPVAGTISRQDRYAGQVDTPSVLWVFFGGGAQPYDHASPQKTVAAAKEAFERWGGNDRLLACQSAMRQ